MPKETSKTIAKGLLHFQYLYGAVMDINSGDDPLPSGDSRIVVPYDRPQGDAGELRNVPNESANAVYSSHCLERMQDINIITYNRCRVIKSSG